MYMRYMFCKPELKDRTKLESPKCNNFPTRILIPMVSNAFDMSDDNVGQKLSRDLRLDSFFLVVLESYIYSVI